MGCGSSTDSVKSESKASLRTAPSSRASSASRTPKLRNKARVAPEVFTNDGRGIDGGSDNPAVLPDDGHQPEDNGGEGRGRTLATHSQEPTGSGDEAPSKRGVMSNNNDTEKQPLKSVAFEVSIDSDVSKSLVKKPPPRRLQKLDNAPRPTFTLEELEKQQQKSAARRRKALEGKSKGSKQSSRRRNDLLAAVKFSEEHQQQVTARKLEEKIDSASKNREKHLQEEVIRKQRIREERAHLAEVRRRRASLDEEIQYDVEKDETFNADDDADSWLDGDNNNTAADTATTKGSAWTTYSERIYDGRSSPAKQLHGGSHNQPHGPADTEESETEAFTSRRGQKEVENDDFFD